jgi:hypothetical protein
MKQYFFMNIEDIQPSQLYINARKLELVTDWFQPELIDSYEAIPIKELNGRIIFTDGHTRAYVTFKKGFHSIKVYWDEDELDLRLYQSCVDWCLGAGISSVKDFDNRVIDPIEYEKLWIKRCENYLEQSEQNEVF